MIYPWLKALHVVSAITWIGGLLVVGVALAWFSQSAVPRTPEESQFLLALRRWDRWISTPAMLLVWVFGITLAIQGGWLTAPWLHAKLTLVVILSALHGIQTGSLRRMLKDPSRRPPAFLRHAGIFTIAFMAAIVILVVVKPF